MRIYSKFLFATAVAICTQFSIFAQHTISGKVNSENGPLIGATVYIEGTYSGATTNVEGNYTIKNVPEGKLFLVASYLGYITQKVELNIKKDITNQNFQLVVDAVSMSKDVVITANKLDENAPIAFQNLDSTYIANNNIGVDLPIILESATSVVSTSDAGNGIGYSGMRIRGSDATRVNITLNGIPLNDPESQGTFFVNLPDFASSADDIQIQRGVGTSTNGAGAFGASVNINTMELKKEAYGKYMLGTGSFNSLRNTFMFGSGLTKNGFAFDGRLSTIQSDGYIDRATSDLKSYYAKAGYYGKKFSAKFITFGGNERTYQAWFGVPGAYLDTARTFNPYDYKDQVDDYSQTFYQMHLNYVINDNWKASLSGFHIIGNGFYEEYKGTDYNKATNPYGSKESLADYGIDPVIIGGDTITETNLVRRRWLDNTFTGGIFNVTYTKGAIEAIIGGGYNQYDGGHFGEVIWAEYASNSQKDHRYYDNTGVKTDANIYGKINWLATDQLNLFGDVQFRNVTYKVSGVDNDQRILNVDDNLNFFNPKLGATYAIDSESKVYVSFARANHEPNRSDYIDAPVGVTPVHESLNDLEAGYRFGGRKIAFSANGYFMSYDNQLVLTGAVNDVGGAIRQNVDNSYRAGIELELGYKILKSLTWNVNATFSENKIKSFTQYVDNWDSGVQSTYQLENTTIAFSPSVIAGSNFTYTHAAFSDKDEIAISLISKYVGEQFMDNTMSSTRKLDGYFTNDVRLAYTLNNFGMNKLQVNFTVRNILNTLYVNNAWTYTFEASWDESQTDVYVSKGNNPNEYQMIGYFPQAEINWMLGLTFDF